MSKTENHGGGVRTSHSASAGGELPPLRRDYTPELKLQVLKESLEPGSSVSIAARRNNINANVVFRWRREYREGYLVDPVASPERRLPESGFLPVGVVDKEGGLRALPAPRNLPVTRVSVPNPAAMRPKTPETMTEPGFIEIETALGVKVRVTGSVDGRVLSLVLAEIRRRP
jgi:transposase